MAAFPRPRFSLRPFYAYKEGELYYLYLDPAAAQGVLHSNQELPHATMPYLSVPVAFILVPTMMLAASCADEHLTAAGRRRRANC